ncbi:MAG: hypothetical protein A4S09_00530 [Proteobacteria bacterium SG_bin7]|nr:MAG: hypothetical protein A4S09_00530 [Proteobacteria bacterium SG_bin7]
MPRISKLFLGITAIFFISCTPFKSAQTDAHKLAGHDPKKPDGYNEIDLEAINKAVDPCDDFYEYACGNWIKNFKLPDDKPSYGKSFNVITDRNLEVNKQLLEAFAAGKTPVPAKYSQKLAEYYSACMDTDSIERDAPKIAGEYLDKIQKSTFADLPQLMATLRLIRASALFTVYASPNPKDSNSMIAEFFQSGMGLEEKAYYVNPENEKTRKKYLEHITKMFVIAGVDSANAEKHAQLVLKIETQLARESLSRSQVFDPSVTTNLTSLAAVKQTFKEASFNLEEYVKALGLNLEGQKINVTAPKYIETVVTVLKTTSFDDLKIYLQWQFLNQSAARLNKAFRDENWAFYEGYMRGAKAQSQRWEVCVGSVDGALGEALGEAFVNKTFGAEGKRRVLEMVNTIYSAFEANLTSLDWLDSETRTKAAEKLHKFITKMGYPDTYRNYDDLKLTHNFLKNEFNVSANEVRFDLEKIGKPVDKSQWGMSPSTVNAYYSSSWNEIVFPAGILQTPFFGLNFSDAANYGAIGSVIGHEISHGFDSGGSQFDGNGNLVDWWTKSSAANFKEKSQCIVNQYGQYKVGNGTPIDGDLTKTENIADNGGLKIAYLAYERAAKEKVKEVIQGYNGHQRFFLSFAQSWCGKSTPEYADTHAKTNEHADAKYRVIGSLVNLPAFANAFSCKEGSKMAPVAKDRCTLW